MVDHTAFLAEGFRACREALLEAAGQANLHLKPATLTKAVRRRCMAEFRIVATLIRRLLFLMALAMELSPLRPRPDACPPRATDVEDVTADFGPPPRGFSLTPPKCGPPVEGIETAGIARPGPVPAAPVTSFWVSLHRVLKQPERYAHRLARTLQRWRERREAKPFILPLAGRHRLSRELGLVASALPQLLAEALADWPDTG